MGNLNNTISCDHVFQYYECDKNGRVILSKLMSMLLALSFHQADSLNIGTDLLMQLNLGWVITEYEVIVNKLPKEHDKVVLETKATCKNRYFAYRQFFVKDGNNILVQINAICVVIDKNKRCIVSIPEKIVDGYNFNNIKEIPRLKKPTSLKSLDKKADYCKEYLVRYFDIDTNDHVNNVNYFDWIMDVLPSHFLDNFNINKMIIKFENEVTYGQKIESSAIEEEKNNGIVHTIHSISKDDVVFAEAELSWKKNNHHVV